MAIMNNLKRRRLGGEKIAALNKAVPILIFALIIPCFLVSCGSDPAGPNTRDTSFEWATAPPEEHGFDPDVLNTLTENTSNRTYGRITSILIARNGYLVYEEYFRGHDRYDLVNIHSCTKSISSALVGIAIHEGKIGGVGDRLFDYLDGYTLFPNGAEDSLFRESLTLEHMLTMTAGFSWEEWDMPYGDPTNTYTQMVNRSDWIQFTLNRSITSEPGTAFEYNTGLSGLMAVILENSTGVRADDYAKEKLFRRIGIKKSTWRMTPNEIPMTGAGMELMPRDMAKFGWLYCQNGVWQGDTIVPSWWVEESHQPHVTFDDGRGYGYQWWMVPMTDENDNQFYVPYALGYGHQYIFVVPNYDMVIVITADNNQDFPETVIYAIIGLIGDGFTP